MDDKHQKPQKPQIPLLELPLPKTIEVNGMLAEKALQRQCVRAFDAWCAYLATVREASFNHTRHAHFHKLADFARFVERTLKLSRASAYRVIQSGVENGLFTKTVSNTANRKPTQPLNKENAIAKPRNTVNDKNTNSGSSHKSVAYITPCGVHRVRDAWLLPTPARTAAYAPYVTGKADEELSTQVNPATAQRRYLTSYQKRQAKQLRLSIKHRRAALTADAAERATDHPRSQRLIGEQTHASQPTVSRRLKLAKAHIVYNHRVLAQSEPILEHSQKHSDALHDFYRRIEQLRSRKGQSYAKRPFAVQRIAIGDGHILLTIQTPAPNTYLPSGVGGARAARHRKTCVDKRRPVKHETCLTLPNEPLVAVNSTHVTVSCTPTFRTKALREAEKRIQVKADKKGRRTTALPRNDLARERAFDLSKRHAYIRHETWHEEGNNGLLKQWKDPRGRTHVAFAMSPENTQQWNNTL